MMANFGWYMIYELKISLTLDIYPLIIRMSYDDWLRNFGKIMIKKRKKNNKFLFPKHDLKIIVKFVI